MKKIHAAFRLPRNASTRGKSIYQKGALSFLAVLFLPVLCFFPIFRFVFYNNILQYNEQLQNNMLQNSVQTLEGLFDGIDSMVTQMANISDLNPNKIKRSLYDASLAKPTLGRLCALNHTIGEGFVVIEGCDYITSEVSTYTFDMIADRVESEMLDACKSFDEVLDKIREARLFPIVKDGHSYIAYTKQIQYPGNLTPAYYVAFLDADKVFATFNRNIANPEQTGTLLAANGALLATTLSETQVAQLAQQEEAPGKYVKLEGQKYQLGYAYNEMLDLYCLYLTNYNYFMAPMAKTTAQFAVGLLAVFAIGLVLIQVLLRYNYRPIRTMQHMIEGYLRKSGNGGDDVDFLTDGLGKIIAENTRLANNINLDKKQLKSFCLFKLLNNQIFDIQATLQVLESAHLHFPDEAFLCMALNMTQQEQNERFSAYIDEERRGECNICHLYYCINGNKIALIFNFSPENKQRVQKAVDCFAGYCADEFQMTIGIGETVLGLEHLREAYSQAKIALEYTEMNATCSKLYFADAHNGENVKKVYRDKLVNKLYHAIRTNEYENVAKTLKELEKTIQHNSLPRYAIKSMYYQIVNSILTASHNPKIFEKGNEILLLIDDMLREYTLEELHSKVTELCSMLVSQSTNVLLLDNVLNYLNKRCFVQEFSIEGMADEFGISHQQMSTLFKKEMHMTIIEYVNNLKLLKATQLLVETNLPVAKIVGEVGYIDSSSFTRKFKQEKGLTPLEYRKKHRSIHYEE